MIFQCAPDEEHKINIGEIVHVLRDREWAHLPAIRWGDDKVVGNVLPMLDAGFYGWYQINKDHSLKQILRPQYDEPTTNDGQYILESENYYLIGKIQWVYSKMAGFGVVAFAEKSIIAELQTFTTDFSLWQLIKAGNSLREYPTILSWFNYRVTIADIRDVPKLRELVDKLPHGAGLNGNWHITREEIGIDYEPMNEFGYYEDTIYVSWKITHDGTRWTLGEYTGDDCEFEDELATMIEENLR